MRYASIDIETTGLNEDDHDLVEFGMVLDDLSNQLPLEQLPVFHTYFKKDNYQGQAGALAMHGEIFRRIDKRVEGYTYLTAEKFGHAVKEFLANNGYNIEKDRIIINVAGKNFGTFDLQFLKQKTDFRKHIKVRSRLLDPGILYYQKGDEALPGLSESLKRAGFESNVKHTAVEDALDVIKLIRAKLG